MRLKGEFIMVPDLSLIDDNLSQADKLVLGLIISLSFKNNYCFASNKYLGMRIRVSPRTITDSLKKLKLNKYIIIKYIDKKRHIYLNKEKVLVEDNSTNEARNCTYLYAEICDHNIKTKYKKKNNISNNPVPIWMEHPEMCESKKASPEEIKEMEDLLKDFK